MDELGQEPIVVVPKVDEFEPVHGLVAVEIDPFVLCVAGSCVSAGEGGVNDADVIVNGGIEEVA